MPKPLRGKRSRRGLTLLELVVVLTILVALAGILVPMVSNLLPLASTSAGATNAAEVEKLVQLYLTVPQSSAAGQNVTVDLLDNIVSAETSQLMTYVPINSAATPPDIVPYTLTAPVVASLNSLGIRNVYQLVENPNPGTNTPPWNPTFFPYTPTYAQNSTAAMPASEPLSDVTTVASLTSAVAAQKFGVPSTGTYVVFGLGKYSAMSGGGGYARYLQETPVAFNPNIGNGPNTVYCRFGLVFQVDPVNGAPATFVGAVEFETTGAMTRDDNLTLNGQTQ